ncbi:MAG: selenide,water dikinase [Pseudohongiellaceae bacterium]|jgi:selenide,water dikinase
MKNNKQAMTLLLVGAGHSHLMVLRYLIKHPIPRLKIQVISQTNYIPYSGMIPGLIAGHYEWQECHIKLPQLCQKAGVELLIGKIDDVDTENKTVSGPGIAPQSYNWLSLNIGSQSHLDNIKGAKYQGIAAKPIEDFLNKWQHLTKKICNHKSNYKIAIVGGGAASFELALAVQYQLKKRLPATAPEPKFILIVPAKQVLPSHKPWISKQAQKILRRRKIKLHTNSVVTEAHHYGVNLKNGESISANTVIWATQAGCPSWIKNTSISCNEQGFIRVNTFLQSISDPDVFAGGDMIDFYDNPLPNNGVFSIQTGKMLAHNIHNTITNKKLLPFKPQKQFLNLLLIGNKSAILSWGNLTGMGRWVWLWKNYLDRRFVRKLNSD